jgi:sterol 3beta-glucosyltransferase
MRPRVVGPGAGGPRLSVRSQGGRPAAIARLGEPRPLPGIGAGDVACDASGVSPRLRALRDGAAAFCAAAQARGETLLLAYSEALLPRSREWPANVETTGWWFLDDGANWTPPPELERFLVDGPPPIYVGFGSMALFDRDASLDMVLRALAQTGARAVVSAGWGGLARDGLTPSVFALDEAPHDWLFPRMAAIAHHGGAGTTGAALRAGRPSVVTPFITDQHAWARLLFTRGLAPTPLPHRRLKADALAAAIRTALSDGAMRERAVAIGATVRAENGLAQAVAAIERAAE